VGAAAFCDHSVHLLFCILQVLSICHPNNPTGCTITESELHDIVDFCREKDIYLLSDETYREMCVACWPSLMLLVIMYRVLLVKSAAGNALPKHVEALH
jgi:aspartate/methionine/tyrosine aminotransferase